MYVNERPISEFNLKLEKVGGFFNAPRMEVARLSLLGRQGVTQVDTSAVVPGRQGMTQLLLYGTSALAGRRDYVTTFARATQGVVQVRFDDAPTRYVNAVVGDLSVETVHGIDMLDAALRLTVTWDIVDPLWYDTVITTLAVPAGATLRTVVATGTAPHGGVLRLAGAGTNPCTVTLRNRGGVTIQTMTLATTWTGSEYVEIDMDRKRLEKVNDTTRTNLLTYLGTTEDFLIFTPEDQPVLTLTGCTGGILYYRKANLG